MDGWMDEWMDVVGDVVDAIKCIQFNVVTMTTIVTEEVNFRVIIFKRHSFERE
jgi:hypothetical protein